MSVMDTYLGITRDSPEEQVMTLLIELGAQVVGAQEGSLLVVDEATQELVFAMTVGRGLGEEELVGHRVPLGQGLVGLAAQTHQVQIGAPVFRLSDEAEKRQAEGEPQAVIAAPLLLQDHLLGVITAVSFKEDKRFGSHDALLYARLAQVAALVIDQHRRLTALKALSQNRRPGAPLREEERLDLEIVDKVSRLVKARPESKAQVVRLLGEILALVES